MFNLYLNVSSYFEFPSFSAAVFTILVTLALSSVIALTYKLIFLKEHSQKKLIPAIMISSAVAAMVEMVAGNNLAVGVSILSIASIISFRTLIRNPRNFIFIFASISIGIATGMFDYVIAISGTILFCYIAVLLYYSPDEHDQNK